MKMIILFLAAFPLVAFGTSHQEDCEVVSYPQVKYSSVDDLLTRVEAERQNANETADAEWREIYARQTSVLEGAVDFARLRNAIIRRDYALYDESANNIVAAFPDGVPEDLEGWNIKLLEVYPMAYEMGFLNIESSWIENAIAQVREAKLSDEVRYRLPIVFYAMSQGNTKPMEAFLSELPEESDQTSVTFLRGYLQYMLSKHMSDMEGLQSAIANFQELATHAGLVQCNSTLLGMAQYYVADSELAIAKMLSRKESAERETYIQLNKANAAIAKARANLDAIYVPGLWSLAYERSAEIFGELAKHSYSKDRASEFEALETEAWLLSRR